MKPTPLNTAVRKSLDALGLARPGQAVVCALSGGPDSVALLDALASLGRLRGFRIVAAHLDHALREGSREDAAFCASLCERLGVELHASRALVRVRAEGERGGLEQAARRERYAFLRRVQQATGAAAIAVAHTEDDQAETVLLRLLRGSGRRGLAAMRERTGDVVRPLLSVSRAAVMAHLQARGLEFRDDPSNRELRFARNRVRHELIPYLERHFNPRLRQTLARSARVLAAESALIDSLTPDADALADGSAGVPLSQLSSLAEPLRRGLVRRALQAAGGLRGVSEIHVQRILGLIARKGAGRLVMLPGQRVASVAAGALRIAPWRAPLAAAAGPGFAEQHPRLEHA